MEEISDKEKLRICSDFIVHSPPGEFNEVFNDVRVLLNNDTLLKEGAKGAFVQYNKDQLTPVAVEGQGQPCLVTSFNDIGNGRFADPRAKVTFKYDHLRKEATDVQPWSSDPELEPLRSSIESKVSTYVSNHFRHGVSSVFAVKGNDQDLPKKAIVVCIEDHQFQPKNYWNGRWRSVWTVDLTSGTSQVTLTGILKVQVHYYEDGNVQLVSSKEVKDTISISNPDSAALELVKVLENAESDYQSAISDNYKTMSDTTFKALRRQLPVTRTKIDWNKIVAYSIGKDLRSALEQ